MKPRLLFFSPAHIYKRELAVNNLEPIVNRVEVWLNHFFDVTTIEHDCSFKEVVERFQPDYCLFDGLIEGFAKCRLAITDIDAYQEIPRAGLCRNDAISPVRGVCWDEFRKLKVEALFTLGDFAMGEAFSDIKNHIFYIPWFINPSLFRDYGEHRHIPIVLFGNFESEPLDTYPWRARVKDRLLNELPSLYFRHPGYVKHEQPPKALMKFGESFARAINASWIAPSSGGFTNIVISKQLEIPASRTLLVTKNCIAARLYGFVDGVNCIFADKEDIVELIREILADESKYSECCDNGYHLVHERHTYKSRRQLLDWFELRKILGRDEKIIQPDLFGPMKIAPVSSTESTLHVEDNDGYKLLALADRRIFERSFAEAEAIISQISRYCPYMTECLVRTAVIRLLSGDTKSAYYHVTEAIKYKTMRSGGVEADPLEWALLLLCYFVSGEQRDQMLHLSTTFESMRRRELDLIRFVIASIAGERTLAQKFLKFAIHAADQHPSIHSMKKYTLKELMSFCITACKVCNRPEDAKACLELSQQLP